MVEGLAGEPLHGVDDRPQGVVHLLQLRQVAAEHDLPRQHPGGRLAQHRHIRIPADAGGVLAHDAVREGVVGRHARADEEVVGGADRRLSARAVLPGEVVEDLRAHELPLAPRRGVRHPAQRSSGDDLREVREQTPPPVLVDDGEAGADALRQLPRRLARERESEDLVPADEPVRDEPDDPGRHGLRLAAAGSGDDEGGLERGLDHLLLGGRRGRESERGGDIGRREHGVRGSCGHALTAGTVWMRHGCTRRWVSAQCAST